jgi:hypothetical protein
VAERDVVPLLARQAHVIFEDRAWLDDLALADVGVALGDVDCRELSSWPRARLTRWLRVRLATLTIDDETYPPSADEVARAVAVVCGEVVACELSGGRRLARSGQRLTLH